jgi:serine/threonine protein kinase
VQVKRLSASQWQLKLIDVGVSRVVAADSTCTSEAWSAYYTAPEVFARMRTKSTVKSPEGEATFRVEGRLKGDIYCLGWVVSELWFEEVGKRRRPRPEDDIPEALRSLIAQCLDPLWKERPSAEEALKMVLKAEDDIRYQAVRQSPQ